MLSARIRFVVGSGGGIWWTSAEDWWLEWLHNVWFGKGSYRMQSYGRRILNFIIYFENL